MPHRLVTQVFAPDLHDAPPKFRDKGIRIVIEGTAGAAVLPELNQDPADRQIVKKRYSPFFGTDLDQCLATLQAKRLIIAGINTHACVRAAAVDAYQRDLEVLLASDCIDSYDAEHHEVSMRYKQQDSRLLAPYTLQLSSERRGPRRAQAWFTTASAQRLFRERPIAQERFSTVSIFHASRLEPSSGVNHLFVVFWQ
jgi:hypothetical protein